MMTIGNSDFGNFPRKSRNRMIMRNTAQNSQRYFAAAGAAGAACISMRRYAPGRRCNRYANGPHWSPKEAARCHGNDNGPVQRRNQGGAVLNCAVSSPQTAQFRRPQPVAVVRPRSALVRACLPLSPGWLPPSCAAILTTANARNRATFVAEECSE